MNKGRITALIVAAMVAGCDAPTPPLRGACSDWDLKTDLYYADCARDEPLASLYSRILVYPVRGAALSSAGPVSTPPLTLTRS